jgi:hypothetical protein
MNKSFAVLVLALPLLSLGSCALFESRATRALRATAEYKTGYGDGCASARPSANPRESTLLRDDEAYRTNRGYRQGWGEGRSACRSMAQMPSPVLGGGSALGGGGLVGTP